VRLEASRATESLDASLVSSEDGFAQLRLEWDALVERLDLPSPFHSWDWNYVWWRHFGGNSRLRIVVFRSDGRLAGLAQLHERRHGGWLTSIVPIGWGNLLTEQLELLFPNQERTRLLGELRRFLSRSSWSWIGLSGLDQSDLREPWEGLGIVNRKDMPFEYRELPRSWDEMVRGLNRSMRSNVKYYPKLMLRSGCPFELRVAESPADVASALPAVYRLHSARAEVREGVAHKDYLERSDHRAFLDDVAPRLAARGEMKVGLLEVRGEVVATQMWLEKSKTMFLYYSGYLPEWSRYSVAMVTTSEILKHGIARGLDRVEFLRGTGQFKTRWDTRQRVQLDVTWARRATTVRTLLNSYRGGRQLLRRAERRLKPETG
jgi:CelD/BcsL family acetyltransferase involved in cellulose biosynthesis